MQLSCASKELSSPVKDTLRVFIAEYAHNAREYRAYNQFLRIFAAYSAVIIFGGSNILFFCDIKSTAIIYKSSKSNIFQEYFETGTIVKYNKYNKIKSNNNILMQI